jgi:phosphate transport system substrate-binding protein
MIIAVTDPEAAEAIAGTAGAFGAASLSTLIVDKPRLNPLSLNGVKGSVRTLADGSYPLAKDIRFIITANESPSARKFLDFVYSAKGRAIAGKSGVLVSTGVR